jgi:hypothetical protein
MNNKAEAKTINFEYKEDKSKDNNINHLLSKYLHEIRNFKILDHEMINNIKNMNNENKMEIIITFNNILQTLLEYNNNN